MIPFVAMIFTFEGRGSLEVTKGKTFAIAAVSWANVTGRGYRASLVADR